MINELFFLFFLFRECCAAYPARAGLSVAMTVLFESTFFLVNCICFFVRSLNFTVLSVVLCYFCSIVIMSHSWRAWEPWVVISSVLASLGSFEHRTDDMDEDEEAQQL